MFGEGNSSFVKTRQLFADNEIYKPFLLNSRAQGVSEKNEQSSQTPWRGTQCSCIGCIGWRPALHHNICQHYEIKTTDNILLHKPDSVAENNKVKILRDFEIRTDRQIQARRPDLVVIDKQTKGLIIDVAIPNDTHIEVNEREKIDKYQDLRLEVQRMWNIKARVVPIVIGALEATSNNLEKQGSRRSLEKTRLPNWQRQQYLAVHTSYERCSIAQSPSKTSRSEKNAYLDTRAEWRTRDNNNYLCQTRGPYHRHNHTTQEHKRWLAIAHYRIGVCTRPTP